MGQKKCLLYLEVFVNNLGFCSLKNNKRALYPWSSEEAVEEVAFLLLPCGMVTTAI